MINKNKTINIIVFIITFLLIGSVLIFSLLPNVVLNAFVTISGFIIPSILILITMIVEIKKSNNINEKKKISRFWLKMLFAIYCLLLITILFLNNEYRMTGFQAINSNTFSAEHLKTINIIPFASIIKYISGWISHSVRTNIVFINLCGNLILFAPLGFFVPILFEDKIKNTKQFILMIIVVTISVEALQFISYTGSTDIDDIILNTIGAVIMFNIMKTKLARKILKKVIEL